MYTSYFANLKNLPENVLPIAICLWTPKWYWGLTYTKLAPSYDLLTDYKISNNEANYKKYFYEDVLDKLDAKSVVSDLKILSGGKDICLICFEKPPEFCHRHLVSDWLNKNGFMCEEF